jgi:glycosyltransferase involved in cell wall biosynthesis
MSRECDFTVIVPTYNRAKLVGRAIQSVFIQTVQPAQVIVVDDGSTDNTADVCQAYGPALQYVRQRNRGAAAARNAGVRLARCPWIAFLDSDDYWTPSHLERMHAAITETSGKAALYFSDLQLPEASGGGTLWEMIGFCPVAPFHLVRDASAWMLMKRQPTMLQSSVLSRRALEIVGGLDESRMVGEDSYLFCQLGIGGIACAVSGTGCVQTADAIFRLTVDNPLESERYLRVQFNCWREVLSWKRRLPPHYSKLVAWKLAAAHLGLGKLLWRDGRCVEAIAHFFLTAKTDPRLVIWFMRNGSSRGYDERVRRLCQTSRGTAPNETEVPWIR